MTKKESQNNPLIDAWKDGQEQFFKAQKKWLDSNSEALKSTDKPQAVTEAEENWEKCKQQYNSWMQTTENWFPSFANFSHPDADISAETVKRMMDPSNFLRSGFDEINQVFFKLVDGPEFADIGLFERKFLKTSKDWIELRKASAEYMEVISQTWSKAFEEYTKDVTENPFNEKDSPKDLLNRWLNIANQKFVETQRTKSFLKAQKGLISAGTRYRLKQREIVEVWCESASIPTRTEVDDLHQTVYKLRRELRVLKRQISEIQDNQSVKKTKKKSISKNTKSKKP